MNRQTILTIIGAILTVFGYKLSAANDLLERVTNAQEYILDQRGSKSDLYQTQDEEGKNQKPDGNWNNFNDWNNFRDWNKENSENDF